MAGDATTISARLCEAMDRLGVKPVELSRRTGISKSSISQYMSGYATPKSDRIYAIARALNVTEAWLLGYDVQMEPIKPVSFSTNAPTETALTPNEKLIIDRFRQLPEDEKISFLGRMLGYTEKFTGENRNE